MALAAVIILSALLVLALIALAAGMMRQYRLYRSGQPAATSAASVTLAPGSRIVSASTESGKLVLHVQTPRGGEVEIFDLSTGKLLTQVKDDPK
jgi:hypothetical protein